MTSPPAGYPQYELPQLEEIARRVLDERLPDGVCIPIGINFLVDTEPGCSLELVSDLRGSRGVAGTILAYPEEGRFTILVDAAIADAAPTFYRFTVAEEFAHLLLHRRVLEQIRTLDDAVNLQGSSDYFYLDRNAKWLAAALLMPTHHLRNDAQEVFAILLSERGRCITSIVIVSLPALAAPGVRHHVMVRAPDLPGGGGVREKRSCAACVSSTPPTTSEQAAAPPGSRPAWLNPAQGAPASKASINATTFRIP